MSPTSAAGGGADGAPPDLLDDSRLRALGLAPGQAVGLIARPGRPIVILNPARLLSADERAALVADAPQDGQRPPAGGIADLRGR